jgi:archaemetzincin
MQILIQPVGNVEEEVLLMLKNLRFFTVKIRDFHMLKESLEDIFGIKSHISPDIVEIPPKSYNPSRNQYYSTLILSFLMNIMKKDSTHVIAVTDVDLYVPGLNFVFGEAECPGNFALISLHRLKHPNGEIFLNRALKEVVHELGHTFGVSHCENHLCVMHFSNSIVETDIKSTQFCKSCLNKIKSV